MRRLCAVGGCIMLVASFASQGTAQTVDLGSFGFWSSYATKGSDGKPLCGIKTTGGEGRMFFIKWFEGSADLTVQIFKNGWTIPANISANIIMRFDRSTPWNVSSKRLSTSTGMLEFTIKNETVRDFTRSFTQSSLMTIDFTGASEASWDMRLNGNSMAINSLAKCVTTLAGRGNTSNPYAYVFNQPPAPGGLASTQPFATNQPLPQASQPFPAEPAPTNRKTFDDEFAGPLKGLQN